MLWLDSAGNPQQWAIATFVDDERVTETTGSSDPFDDVASVCDVALHAVAVQLKLL